MIRAEEKILWLKEMVGVVCLCSAWLSELWAPETDRSSLESAYADLKQGFLELFLLVLVLLPGELDMKEFGSFCSVYRIAVE